MTATFSPDLSDTSRCVSAHWSLPVQCVLPRTHRENWHEAWHPETGNRLRYRYGTRATQELHHGEWHDVELPASEKVADKLPSRFHATPADVDRYLRTILAEDTYLRYQQVIGGEAVEEAAKDLRMEANAGAAEGMSSVLFAAFTKAADHIDPMKSGGPFPSTLLCSQHGGFGPCPGAPRCTPKQEAVEFVDGRGDRWLSTGRIDTDGYDVLASIDDPDTVESTESILQRTGSLREIGRCL